MLLNIVAKGGIASFEKIIFVTMFSKKPYAVVASEIVYMREMVNINSVCENSFTIMNSQQTRAIYNKPVIRLHLFVSK